MGSCPLLFFASVFFLASFLFLFRLPNLSPSTLSPVQAALKQVKQWVEQAIPHEYLADRSCVVDVSEVRRFPHPLQHAPQHNNPVISKGGGRRGGKTPRFLVVVTRTLKCA